MGMVDFALAHLLGAGRGRKTRPANLHVERVGSRQEVCKDVLVVPSRNIIQARDLCEQTPLTRESPLSHRCSPDCSTASKRCARTHNVLVARPIASKRRSSSVICSSDSVIPRHRANGCVGRTGPADRGHSPSRLAVYQRIGVPVVRESAQATVLSTLPAHPAKHRRNRRSIGDCARPARWLECARMRLRALISPPSWPTYDTQENFLRTFRRWPEMHLGHLQRLSMPEEGLEPPTRGL